MTWVEESIRIEGDIKERYLASGLCFLLDDDDDDDVQGQWLKSVYQKIYL